MGHTCNPPDWTYIHQESTANIRSPGETFVGKNDNFGLICQNTFYLKCAIQQNNSLIQLQRLEMLNQNLKNFGYFVQLI